jgi:hypothetical protein
MQTRVCYDRIPPAHLNTHIITDREADFDQEEPANQKAKIEEETVMTVSRPPSLFTLPR